MAVNIISAGYGNLNKTVDVTKALKRAYLEGQRSFQANNNWGGDPAQGESKYLYIFWENNGIPCSGVAVQDDDKAIVIPDQTGPKNFPGLINGLLTGGILIGKIAQALGKNKTSKTYVDPESGISVTGEATAGGVKFFRTTSSDQSTSTVYAYNPDTTSHAIVSVPNKSDESGLMYIINPTEKVPFDEVDSPKVSPMVDVTTSLTNNPSALLDLRSSSVREKNILKLTFKGLKIGNTVDVGSFSLSADTLQLFILAGSATIVALFYLYVISDKGVTIANQNPILPSLQNEPNADCTVEYRFPINFASLGIDLNTDTIDGQIHLEIDSPISNFTKLSKVPSEPLLPAEREFFERLSRNEL